MKICVIGAPSTGKSAFARGLSAEMTKQGMSVELVQEYASAYIQEAGAPLQAWEQLVISIGQYLSEQQTTRDHMVTDAAAFATYIYAQKLIPQMSNDKDWPKYRALLDVIRSMARVSLDSYDTIFLMNHVFTPRSDGVRIEAHISSKVCQEINRDIENFLVSERVNFHKIRGNDSKATDKAISIIKQQELIGSKVVA